MLHPRIASALSALLFVASSSAAEPLLLDQLVIERAGSVDLVHPRIAQDGERSHVREGLVAGTDGFQVVADSLSWTWYHDDQGARPDDVVMAGDPLRWSSQGVEPTLIPLRTQIEARRATADWQADRQRYLLQLHDTAAWHGSWWNGRSWHPFTLNADHLRAEVSIRPEQQGVRQALWSHEAGFVEWQAGSAAHATAGRAGQLGYGAADGGLVTLSEPWSVRLRPRQRGASAALLHGTGRGQWPLQVQTDAQAMMEGGIAIQAEGVLALGESLRIQGRKNRLQELELHGSAHHPLSLDGRLAPLSARMRLLAARLRVQSDEGGRSYLLEAWDVSDCAGWVSQDGSWHIVQASAARLQARLQQREDGSWQLARVVLHGSDRRPARLSRARHQDGGVITTTGSMIAIDFDEQGWSGQTGRDQTHRSNDEERLSVSGWNLAQALPWARTLLEHGDPSATSLRFRRTVESSGSE